MVTLSLETNIQFQQSVVVCMEMQLSDVDFKRIFLLCIASFFQTMRLTGYMSLHETL